MAKKKKNNMPLNSTTEKRFVSTENKEFNDKELSFVAYASKEVIDRDGELIKSNAWELDDYRKNPVVLLSHDYSQLPVGKSLWEKMGPDGLKFKPKFANTDTGREVYQLYKEGILNAFSVGFIPMEWDEGDGESKAHRVYTKAKLLEVSCVAVPSCPDALVERMVSKGIKTKELDKALHEIIPQEAVDAFIAKIADAVKLEDTEEKDTDTTTQKTIGLDGLVSVRDISRAIESALSRTPEGESYVWVVDMYPNTSESGSTVVQFDNAINDSRSRYWHYNYVYNRETESATLSNPIAVEEGFFRKSFINALEKAGRELSARNITALKNIASKMHDAAGGIDTMLSGKDDKTVDDVKEKTTDTDVKPEELTSDEVIKIVSEGFKTVAKDVTETQLTAEDIRNAVTDEIKRAQGRLN